MSCQPNASENLALQNGSFPHFAHMDILPNVHVLIAARGAYACSLADPETEPGPLDQLKFAIALFWYNKLSQPTKSGLG